MPTHVEKRIGKRPYKIVEPSGKIVGSSTSKEKAESSSRVRNAARHGWKPSRKK